MSAPPNKISELNHSMKSCISDVNVWATVNMFELNDKKEMTRKNSCLSPLKEISISITYLLQSLSAMLKFTSNSVKIFDFTLDCHLTMNAHVFNIAQTCYFELRRLASICRFLTSTATATLASAFVLLRIDYCKSLLFGSTHDVTFHLQQYRTMQLE